MTAPQPASRSTALLSVALLLALAPATCALAATSSSHSAPYSASVTLNHQISYPRFLSFGVGAAGAAISLVSCDLSALAASLGSGAPLPCGGGDLGGGQSSVQVKSNAGQINITVTTTGALLSGPDSIGFSEITTASSDANLPAPVLPALGGTSSAVSVVLKTGNITDRSAAWKYQYANTAVRAAGTYGGVNLNNGRVTYTASSP